MKFDFFTRRFIDTGVERDKLAVVGVDRSLTWGELEQEVATLVQTFESCSIPRGHPVIIYGKKEAGFVVSMLAAISAEVPYIPIDNFSPVERLHKIQNQVGSRVLILCGTDRVPGFDVVLRPVAPAALVDSHKEGVFPHIGGPAPGDPLVYLIFTSGSSGEPKGVQISRSNVLDLLEWVISPDFAFRSDDVLINQCSFSFDVSFFDLLASLHHGSTIILNAPELIKDPMAFLARLKRHHPTHWVSTPSFLALAVANGEFNGTNLPALKTFILAGEILHPNLVQKVWQSFPGARVLNAYGPTEITVIVTMVEITPAMMETYSILPIGYVKKNSRMELINAKEDEDGVVKGEWTILVENVSPGYFGNPHLTAEKFFTAADGVRGYRTGDYGYYCDGMVFYLGRLDSQIKLHGFRIELDEIDAQILKHPAIAESVTIPLRRNGDVKKLVTFIKRTPEAFGTDEEVLRSVRAHLAAQVPDYMIPGELKLVASFPYSAAHKIDRNKLLEELGA